MNTETIKLIEQLAQKLGTTSEYLWLVLLKQAPISATISLIQIILTIVAGIALFKMNKHFSDDDNKLSYYNADFLPLPMAIATVLWAIFAIAGFFYIGDIFNGYFNPEFWALDYIFNSLKSK